MFGYIKPVKPELRIREYDYYRAHYCGLCNSLRTRCGFLARFVVNYDFTFVSLLLAYAEKQEGALCKKRCLVCPTGRNSFVSDVSDKVADISVILTYLKLSDDISDNRSFGSWMIRSMLIPAFRRAKRAEPKFASVAEKLFQELAELEKAKTPSIDETADKFANMLVSILDETEKNFRVLKEILYHIGRFVYIIDALDDYEKDIRASEYNPIAARFDIATEALSEEIAGEVASTLLLDVNAILTAFELLEKDENTGLLRNIIELGMKNSIALVLKKEKQK